MATLPAGDHRGSLLTEHDDTRRDASSDRVRVRVRKRKKRKRDRPLAWLVLPVLGGIVLLVVVAAALLVRDLVTVRQSLAAAQESLTEVRSAAGAIDVDAASASLRRADQELSVARSRSSGPLWSLARRVPVAGDSIEVTQGVVRVASAALDVAQRAVTGGDDLLGDGLDVRVDDGQVDLTPLREAGALLDSLPLDRLVTARDDLAAVQPGWAPQELLDGRRDTLALADEAIVSVERGRELLSALPAFLGGDGPRRYFLGMQTPAELRGTGGLLGFWAVLDVDDGRIELSGSDVYDVLDESDVTRAAEDGEVTEASVEDDAGPTTGQIGSLGGDIWDGVAGPEGFEDRYGHTAATGFFANVNLDPDLPTVASVALDLFEARTGDRLDGMILLDPVGMQHVLAATGDDRLELPPEAVAAGAPSSVPVDEFARFATVDVYDALGADRTDERKLALRQLGDLAFARVFDGAWDGVRMSRAIGDASSGRHVQVFSRDEEVQASFAAVGAAGALEPNEGQDLLALVANNAVGGKHDVHVGHELHGTIELREPLQDPAGAVTVEREAALRVELDNPLPTEGLDQYIIGSCLLPPHGGCFDGPAGENRTWFSLWTLGDATQREPAGGTPVSSERFRGLRVFDQYVETASQQRNGFDVAFQGEAPVAQVDEDLVYELQLWHQSKAVPTLLDLTIHAPDGWQVVGAELLGGGDGRGLGVHGDGEPVEVTANDGDVQLRGTVSADATLRVVLERNPE